MDLARYYGRGVLVVTHDRDFAAAADHAGELDEQPVSGGFNDAAPVLGDLGVDQLTAICLQPREAPSLSAPISRL